METISTHTSRLTVGDVVLHHGAPARVIRVGETHTPGTWSVTVDHRGNETGLIESSIIRDHDAVWEVVTSAHTVRRGDVVRIGSGRVVWTVRGYDLDGRARVATATRKLRVDVARLVVERDGRA